MKEVATVSERGDYVLATGEAAAHRLRMLHSIYGPGALRLLNRAGIQRGMRVADLGCGVGMLPKLGGWSVLMAKRWAHFSGAHGTSA